MLLIGRPGEDSFAHVFGGSDWTVSGPQGSHPPAGLVVTLDGTDPRLSLNVRGAIPLCTRMDGFAAEPQRYKILRIERRVMFGGLPWSAPIDDQDLVALPLPRIPLRLMPPEPGEDPSQSSKYEVQDTFIGGEGFIRIGGEPLWLGEDEDHECTCGTLMSFVACLGYENPAKRSILGALGPFFLGEVAEYFFLCVSCDEVAVVSQPT
jgi:hypothetical protein